MRTRLSIPLVFVMILAVLPIGPAAAVAPEPIVAVGFVPADHLQVEFDAFTAMTGIPVLYEELGHDDPFEDLLSRIDSGEPPDVVVGLGFWQLFQLEEELVDLSQFVKAKNLRKRFSSYLIDMATAESGAVLGAPIAAELKTLVWYKPAEFEAAGYAIPETFDELVALSDQIVADGRYPWCNYIGSGEFTGWLGTDWIEDLLLGAEGPEVYDGWVSHDVPFSDPRVEDAFERYQRMIDTPGYVFDRDGMLEVGFQENVWPLDNGDCLMHRQADFFGGFGGVEGQFSTFKFPSVNPEFEDAAMGGAKYVAALNNRKETGKLIKFMVSAEFGKAALAASGTWLLPHQGFDRSFYMDEMVRSWAGIVRSAIKDELFRFDGSDLMPGHIGAGAFWAAIQDLVSGRETIPGVLTHLDASWDGTYPVVMPGWTTGGPLYEAAYALIDALPSPDEGNFFVIRAEDPREMYDLLCEMPDTAVGMGVDTLVYSFASADCGVKASFKAIRFGYDSYWSQFLVSRDSEIDAIEDLSGLNWTYPSRSSLSGYVVPLAMMAAEGVSPGPEHEVGTHHAAVRAVYDGETEFSTTYFSPPLLPTGEWQPGDEPDIPYPELESCGWEEEGLFCGAENEWRVLDPRANNNLRDLDEIVQRVRILGISEPIPNDAVTFGEGFDPAFRLQIENALKEFDFEGSDFGAVYAWQGINPAADEEWDWIRSALIAAGFNVDGELPAPPQIRANQQADFVDGWGFTQDASVTVVITDGTGVIFSESVPVHETETYFSVEPGIDILPDHVVTVTGDDSGAAKTLVVSALTFDLFDVTGDVMAGTAPAGTEVRINGGDEFDWFELFVVADGSGNWVADLSTEFDLTYDTWAEAAIDDEDGDATFAWTPPLPQFGVGPAWDGMWGDQWAANAPLTITVNAVAVPGGPYSTNEWGYFDAWWDQTVLDLQAGDVVVVSDGIATKQHTITELAITGVDPDLDQVSGVAAPGSQVAIWVHEVDVWQEVTVGGDRGDGLGEWTADFSSQVDLVAGSNGNSNQCDDDADCTYADWEVPNPQFGVDPASDGMWGDQWAANAPLTITVNAVALPGGPFVTDESGHFDAWWDQTGFDLRAGDVVVVSDGIATKQHTITELAVTDVDPDTDVVSGMAAPGSDLEVWVHDVDAWRHVTACDDSAEFPCGGDPLGTWQADFGNVGEEPGEEGLADLVAGSNGNSGQCDDDGDCTTAYWEIPNPQFGVDPAWDGMWGDQWPANTLLTITVDDGSGAGPVPLPGGPYYTDEWGHFDAWWDQTGLDLRAGDVVVVSDGITTKEHAITDLAVTGVDPVADVVSGTAAPGSQLAVWVHDVDVWVELTADSVTGLWAADFSGQVDLVAGSNGNSGQCDDDGDCTTAYWEVVIP